MTTNSRADARELSIALVTSVLLDERHHRDQILSELCYNRESATVGLETLANILDGIVRLVAATVERPGAGPDIWRSCALIMARNVGGEV